MSRQDDEFTRERTVVYEAGSDHPLAIYEGEMDVIEATSRATMALVYEEEQKQACNEISKFVSSNLRGFKDAAESELEVNVTYEWNYAAYRLKVDFHFNGYIYTSDRRLKEEAVNAHLDSVEVWKDFLRREVQSIHEGLWSELRKHGITKLPAPMDDFRKADGWYEAKGDGGPRGAPANPEVGQIHKDLFGVPWVFDGTGWRHIGGAHRAQTIADIDREREEALFKEGEAKTMAAIVQSIQALNPPQEDSSCPSDT